MGTVYSADSSSRRDSTIPPLASEHQHAEAYDHEPRHERPPSYVLAAPADPDAAATIVSGGPRALG